MMSGVQLLGMLLDEKKIPIKTSRMECEEEVERYERKLMFEYEKVLRFVFLKA